MSDVVSGDAPSSRRVAVATAVLVSLSGGSGLALPTANAGLQEAAPEVVRYVSELPRGSLSEFRYWDDRASPGGRLVGYPHTGDELDPPPEDDPHVTVRAG
jgi:hypothetical protein